MGAQSIESHRRKAGKVLKSQTVSEMCPTLVIHVSCKGCRFLGQCRGSAQRLDTHWRQPSLYDTGIYWAKELQDRAWPKKLECGEDGVWQTSRGRCWGGTLSHRVSRDGMSIRRSNRARPVSQEFSLPSVSPTDSFGRLDRAIVRASTSSLSV